MRTHRQRRGRAPVAVLALLLALVGTTVSASADTDAARTRAVVVQAGSAHQAAAAVAALGGHVDRELSYIGAVAATLSDRDVATLESQPGIDVVADHPLEFLQVAQDTALAEDVTRQALNPGADWSPEAGAGVGVALIDTGVADSPDLEGRVVHGPDYSDEGDGVDRFGHGTFMAGLIAGDGTASPDDPQYGAAPGAHIVSLKLAGRDGVTSLSKVLDAIGWVITNQDEYGIRVLSLSVGAPTNVAPQADPLSAAVQAAWASGITVVAASGNEGDEGVTSPGRDPWVLTVGASDPNGTVDVADDTVPDWSGQGRVTSFQKPDVVAPGTSVVSLRAPGSHIDESHPQAQVGESYFRGSGTSMSTALVAGAVAVLAEHRPYATPDDLKGAVVSTARPLEGERAPTVDLAAADQAVADAAWRQGHALSPVVKADLGNRMPWNRDTSPTPDEAWARMSWADGKWQRMSWADVDHHRMSWADLEHQRMSWARMSWADVDFERMSWARMSWADANFARMSWADANFTRMSWARMSWARMSWADADFARMSWASSWPVVSTP